MATAPLTANLTAQLAKEIAAALSRPGCDFSPHGRPEDLGSSAHLEVRTGERRAPGADYRVVDTERVFDISISERPREQRYG
jgi:hypothetical protein